MLDVHAPHETTHYEQGILAGKSRADENMMAINQERFEDNQDPIQ